MKALFFALFLPSVLFGQNLNANQIDKYANHIDSLKSSEALDAFFYPNMCTWGGLTGYYLKDELVYLKGHYGAESGFQEMELYVKDGINYKYAFYSHQANWKEYEKLTENIESEFESMTFIDSWKTFRFDGTNEFIVEDATGNTQREKKEAEKFEYFLGELEYVKEIIEREKMGVIKFTEHVDGDFSFRKDWSYIEGVYVNRHGQLSCDGFCPERAHGMKDSEGRLIEDSLSAFYSIVDTTHYSHTISCDASMYEFGGTDFIDFEKKGLSFIGTTRGSAGTHSGLVIEIQGDLFDAWVIFNSITETPIQKFKIKSGSLIMDKELLEKNILKGTFDFTFKNTFDENVPLTWKGSFYSE